MNKTTRIIIAVIVGFILGYLVNFLFVMIIMLQPTGILGDIIVSARPVIVEFPGIAISIAILSGWFLGYKGAFKFTKDKPHIVSAFFRILLMVIIVIFLAFSLFILLIAR